MTGRPNVVVVVADDAGVGDVGVYNSQSRVPTPNVDAIGAAGTVFEAAYAPGAVCTQTRYGLLTGRYHARTEHRGAGVVFDYTEPLIADTTTLQQTLADAGYRTYCAGKWHLGIDWTERAAERVDGQFRNAAIDFTAPFDGPTAHGFDHFYGIRASHDMPPYCLLEDGHVVGVPTGEKETYHAQQRPGPESRAWDDRALGQRITARSLAYLTDAAHRDEPFFLYVPTSAPHRPCLPPDHVAGRSDAGARGDMVAQYDWTVGCIDRQLDELGLRDDTILVVTSDHGPQPAPGATGHRPANGRRGQKATLYEGGIRVPLVARGPRLGDESEMPTSDPVSLVDLRRTVQRAVGLPVDDDLDGVAWTAADAAGRRPIVAEAGDGRLAVRRGPWKYVQSEGPRDELYHLDDDPTERDDRIDARPTVAADLRETLARTVAGAE